MDADSQIERARGARRPRWIDRLEGRLLAAVGITAAVTFALWLVLGSPQLGIDDADILRVYGRNLAAGHGPVYTPGFERVEGYSSPAWMLIWAAAYRLPGDPVAIVGALAFALCCTCVWVLLGVVSQLTRGRGAWVLAALLLATTPGFFAWNTLTLMDLSLWSALIALFVGLQARLLLGAARLPRSGLSAVLGLLILARPEGMALGPVFGLLSFAAVSTLHGTRAALRSHAIPALVCVTCLGGLLAVRWSVFGYLLPNTYYAKVSNDWLYNLSHGLAYSIDFLRSPWMAVCAPLCLALLLFALTPAGRRRNARGGPALFATQCAAIALIGLGLPLLEGGDHFGAHRLLQPFLLPAAVPAFYLLEQLRRRLPMEERKELWPPGFVTGAVIVVATGFAWAEFRLSSNLVREFAIASHGRDLGLALNAATDPRDRPRVGVITAGGVAINYDGRVLDLMGLNWTAMAHSDGRRYGPKNHAAFHPDVFWSEAPELVAPCLIADAPGPDQLPVNDFSASVLRGLLDTERFQRAYELRALPCPAGYVFAYARRDWPGPTVAQR